MSRPDEEFQRGASDGLSAAALFLEATAADFDQLADQRDVHMGPHVFGFSDAKRVTRGLREKAQLLRGQAGHVRGITVPFTPRRSPR